MQTKNHPPEPTHVVGTIRGERMVIDKGREPGRGNRGSFRTARDSTGVNAKDREPIDPRMPHLPPA